MNCSIMLFWVLNIVIHILSCLIKAYSTVFTVFEKSVTIFTNFILIEPRIWCEERVHMDAHLYTEEKERKSVSLNWFSWFAKWNEFALPSERKTNIIKGKQTHHQKNPGWSNQSNWKLFFYQSTPNVSTVEEKKSFFKAFFMPK